MEDLLPSELACEKRLRRSISTLANSPKPTEIWAANPIMVSFVKQSAAKISFTEGICVRRTPRKKVSRRA
jgi:hypothetical protein